MKPKAKHPFKVNVWAGISKRGATPVLIFTGIMRKEFYVEQILRNVLLPFNKRCLLMAIVSSRTRDEIDAMRNMKKSVR